MYVYDLTLSKAGTHAGATGPKRLRMYYFSGGGWQNPPSSQHWKFCAELARQAGKGVIDGPNLLKPHAILLVSPAVDLGPTRKEGPIVDVARKDPVLTISLHDSGARTWAQAEDPGQPSISAIMADATPLARTGAKIIGVTGGWDILPPSALEFRDAAREQGVAGARLHWEKQIHCLPLAFMVYPRL
ncbi:hypothetical protein BDZ85DRAFT_302983 [Elsinoe ampelina]|uniref:Alpha/beta hydrolase fold-3 domain-containing protein n=1 Tax=Elsinoe ampelina TaxID=302913 RepID=A0A6A6G4W2_9PEZI|nr:hypothetical protein BDZ85DRAFT_302983 [Elsinoe ampelina]